MAEELHTQIDAKTLTPLTSDAAINSAFPNETEPNATLSNNDGSGRALNPNYNRFAEADGGFPPESVVSSIINVPDDASGSSSVPPNNVSPGPIPSPTPGEAFETNVSTRAMGLQFGGNSTGIFEYDGTPNSTPQGEFANAINKFPPRLN